MVRGELRAADRNRVSRLTQMVLLAALLLIISGSNTSTADAYPSVETIEIIDAGGSATGQAAQVVDCPIDLPDCADTTLRIRLDSVPLPDHALCVFSSWVVNQASCPEIRGLGTGVALDVVVEHPIDVEGCVRAWVTDPEAPPDEADGPVSANFCWVVDSSYTATVIDTPDLVGPNLNLSPQRAAGLDVTDRAIVLDAYTSIFVPAYRQEYSWTGSAESCDSGTWVPALEPQSLAMINFLRSMAGLTDVSLSAEKNAAAAEAALMMAANDSLDHHPPTNWQCYSDLGAQGALESNLHMGYVGPRGIFQNFGSPPHRAWTLNPQDGLAFGVGSALSSGGRAVTAISVLPNTTELHLPSTATDVLWPPAGQVPSGLLLEPSAWKWTARFGLPADLRDRYVGTAINDFVRVTVPSLGLELDQYGVCSGFLIACPNLDPIMEELDTGDLTIHVESGFDLDPFFGSEVVEIRMNYDITVFPSPMPWVVDPEDPVDPPDPVPGNRFLDVPDNHTFHDDIEWLAAEGITTGCNPPANDLFCPNKPVTRGQMAAFLVRALDYTDTGTGNLFTDDDGSVFEIDIDKLGTAGVTRGCNPPTNDLFCPNKSVTRGQMAAFLRRALVR